MHKIIHLKKHPVQLQQVDLFFIFHYQVVGKDCQKKCNFDRKMQNGFVIKYAILSIMHAL